MTYGEKKITTQKQLRIKKENIEITQEVVGFDMSYHMITPNSTSVSNGKLTCYLCSLRGLNRKAKYGCTKCERGIHVECFTAFHYHDVLKDKTSSLKSALDAILLRVSNDPISRTKKRPNKSIISIENLKLPDVAHCNKRLSISSDSTLP